jgi:hypothetical protein
MSFEIGPLPPIQSGAPARPAQTPRAERSIPAAPPVEVLDEIGAAADRAHQLWMENRELHFARDAVTGRLVIEARDRAGNTIGTIAPSEALDVLAGASLTCGPPRR